MFLRLLLLLVASSAAYAEPLRTKNVLFISTDGLRWQEVFRGAEEELLNKATTTGVIAFSNNHLSIGLSPRSTLICSAAVWRIMRMPEGPIESK